MPTVNELQEQLADAESHLRVAKAIRYQVVVLGNDRLQTTRNDAPDGFSDVDKDRFMKKETWDLYKEPGQPDKDIKSITERLENAKKAVQEAKEAVQKTKG